jgi:hypothetical protein
MLKLETWATKRPTHIRIIAQCLAINAATYFETLTEIQDNRIPDQFKPPNICKWFKFYRQKDYLSQYLISIINQSAEFPTLYAKSLQELSNTTTSAIDSIEAQDQRVIIEEISKDQISRIKNEIKNSQLDKNLTEFFQHITNRPEFLFLIKVDLPCWLLYQENYLTIFNKARLGKIESLDKLLRIDKHIIQNATINKWITHYYFQKDRRAFETLSEAIRNPPRHKLTAAQLRYRIAGLISYITELLGKRLYAPEIQSLFNAVAVDYGIDELIDPDLPDSPATFSRAVLRARSFWKTAFPN